MQERQGIEGTGRLLSRCPSAVKLVVSIRCGAYMWKGAAR